MYVGTHGGVEFLWTMHRFEYSRKPSKSAYLERNTIRRLQRKDKKDLDSSATGWPKEAYKIQMPLSGRRMSTRKKNDSISTG
ncbi:uncharacterized protein LOC119176453 isoform X5 [Rhipicephalus microplus]|uniref:uncharacterized protein LOC119176453 isoform X5 n=1 Tax=Rhipicephalus microplus TaxID=6941 RepID=UPI003F6D1D7E